MVCLANRWPLFLSPFCDCGPVGFPVKGEAVPRSPKARVHFAPKDLRIAASLGDLEQVHGYLQSKPEYLDRKDKNGWTALHMAIRGGHTPVVVHLVEFGCDYDAPTVDNVFPLQLAIDAWGENHPISVFLRETGAKTSNDVEEAGDFDNYIEEGRSRLDQFLGTEEDEEEDLGYRDEL